LTSLLGRWGCAVRAVRDEAEALRVLGTGFVPDAVLCDYQLANRHTGAQALTAVRDALRRNGQEDAVMLLITGDMASGELATLAAQGIPILHKPVTPARLRRTLETLWQQARQVHQVRDAHQVQPQGKPSPAGELPRLAEDGQREVS
jgi:two-component system, sensor histidine kinase